MRYKNKPHILRTLFRLWWAWRKCPQLRLMQLIDNAFINAGSTGANIGGQPYDPFDVYDEAVCERVEQFVTRDRR